MLPRIVADLKASPRLIVEAQPGAGKTTRVPLALLDASFLGGQRILMLEPRRLAARAAARHMSRLLGEETGRTVGFRTALDGRESANTRILVVTEGILTRRIQDDPGLAGVGCVIFDEFHERSVHADLGLALCLETQEALRPDLRLIVMSATLDGESLSGLLGGCPRAAAEGRGFPVTVRYLPPARPGIPCEESAAGALSSALREEAGDILVFLPGGAEIRRLAGMLAKWPLRGVDVLPLYGDLSTAAQDSAVAPSAPGRRKIVLATNIAESSLTIEGVRVVIDTGLVRRQRVEPRFGMGRLVTERISRASAEQRCGRAGRIAPGLCLRLWGEHEQAALRPQARPEILDGDPASLCLELAVWGTPVTGELPAGLPLLDLPPRAAWEGAARLLRDLDAVDGQGRATARGRAMAALPLHPRLAHMVLEGKAMGRGYTACALAALFSERDPLRAGAGQGAGGAWGADMAHRLALLLDSPRAGGHGAGPRPHEKKPGGQNALCERFAGPEGAVNRGCPGTANGLRGAEENLPRRLREQARRIAQRAGVDPRRMADEPPDSGPLLALAWPERVALRRAPGQYLMAGGRGAALAPGDPLAAHPLLAIAALDLGGAGAQSHAPGGAASPGDARIHLAAPLRREDLERLFARRITRETAVTWDEERGAVSARLLRRLDALTLEETPLADAPAALVRTVLLEALQRMELAALPWTAELAAWRRRVRFARGLARDGAVPGKEGGPAAPGDSGGWPDLSDAALAASLPEWLGPYLDGIDRLAGLTPALLEEALRGLLPWPLPRLLDELAPERLAVPSGSRIRLDYADAADAADRAFGVATACACARDENMPAGAVRIGGPASPGAEGRACGPDAAAPGAEAAPTGRAGGEIPGPVLAVKLQELFGLAETPAVGGGRVPVVIHLLSPAGRPVQITRDLAGFWKTGYAAVRAELRGRYPKHPWPEDPLSAPPTRHTKKRSGPG